MKKILLVDGNSMLFRAYYATAYGRMMTSPEGVPTNAVYGFAMMIQKAMETVRPDAVMVAFDAGKHTFRHELYADYKGGRRQTPEELVPQFGMVRNYLDSFRITWVEMQDIEADDLIGSMAKQSDQFETTILTSDHDLLQLIDETTTVMLMKKGITEMDVMTAERLKDEMGITPLQVIDLKGLMGDSSDNIPGIPGVGEKTAQKLLAEYGTVENVLAHVDELKGALQKKVREGTDSALMSKRLATIKTDVALEIHPEDCLFDPDYEHLILFFRSLGMRTLAEKYEPYLSGEQTETPKTEGSFERVSVCPSGIYDKDFAVYADASPEHYLFAQVHGLAVTDGKRAVYLSLSDAKKDTGLLAALKQPKGACIGYDIKRNMHVLQTGGIEIAYTDDAMIMASLADSTLTDTDKIFARFNLGTTHTAEEVYGKKGRPVLLPDEGLQCSYACEMADHIYRLYGQCLPMLKEYGMESLYREIEMKLSPILYRMEEAGIVCDRNVLKELSEEMKEQIDAEQKMIFELAEEEFNLNSPKQLAEVLYDRLGLRAGKKRSTSAEVLENLEDAHPVIRHILHYRKLQKLYSTYADGLLKYIHTDGRIHTLYNQCATQTGRLSSSEPNLQNISVRDEQGKLIRKAFLASEGCRLISSDYHQIELRMLAHMANEPGLMEAFNSGLDVHTKTAMDIFGVLKEEVTPEMRRRAKTVNFGIVYGISDFGLAKQLGISPKEAGRFIATYYEKYPGIRSFMDRIVSECEEKGYVVTLMGRRRDIPEIHDKNYMVREFGKRAAMNAPIQGSAADLIKIAMIRIDSEIRKRSLRSKMILQVHDELIFDVPENEVQEMKQLIEEGMIHAMKLNVPLTVECSVAGSWYEAK